MKRRGKPKRPLKLRKRDKRMNREGLMKSKRRRLNWLENRKGKKRRRKKPKPSNNL